MAETFGADSPPPPCGEGVGGGGRRDQLERRRLRERSQPAPSDHQFFRTPTPCPLPTRGRGRIAAVLGALAFALPASAQFDGLGDPDDVTFELSIAANTRAEVYIGREPQLLLICLVGGAQAVIDISSQRASRAVLDGDECVLVSEQEVYATVPSGQPEATISVRVLRDGGD